MNKSNKKLDLPWHTVEKAIGQEITWLKDVIDTRGQEGVLSVPKEINKWAGNYYLYRLIAILIVSGQIKAREISSDHLWGEIDYPEIEKLHKHGKGWHIKMMNIIDDYFKSQDYDITVEPNTYHGRADLGVFRRGKKDLYVEVGTIDIYKLCVNLHFMKNFIFIVVHAVKENIRVFLTI